MLIIKFCALIVVISWPGSRWGSGCWCGPYALCPASRITCKSTSPRSSFGQKVPLSATCITSDILGPPASPSPMALPSSLPSLEIGFELFCVRIDWLWRAFACISGMVWISLLGSLLLFALLPSPFSFFSSTEELRF